MQYWIVRSYPSRDIGTLAFEPLLFGKRTSYQRAAPEAEMEASVRRFPCEAAFNRKLFAPLTLPSGPYVTPATLEELARQQASIVAVPETAISVDKDRKLA
ncbi:hypothetical protein [Bradyrhizobium sp. 144]|uniref:hypothetical protein n=1 Tax=Bradyrhizobium sp. 144 TaxID=2782620 RepID=UPI001FF80F9D|nr:hypothetical protein [Bradyrhizobium sp. 144]MCK1693049.1 hypothetical protein [Bradyrhizobium sp. 144]